MFLYQLYNIWFTYCFFKDDNDVELNIALQICSLKLTPYSFIPSLYFEKYCPSPRETCLIFGLSLHDVKTGIISAVIEPNDTAIDKNLLIFFIKNLYFIIYFIMYLILYET